MAYPAIWFGSPSATMIMNEQSNLGKMLAEIRECKIKLEKDQAKTKEQLDQEYRALAQQINEAKTMYQQWIEQVQQKHNNIQRDIQFYEETAKKMQQHVNQLKESASNMNLLIENRNRDWKEQSAAYNTWLKNAQTQCPLAHVYDQENDGTKRLDEFILPDTDHEMINISHPNK